MFVTQCNTNVVKVHHYKCKPSLQVRRYYLLCLFLIFASLGRLSAQLHAGLSASAYFGCPPLTVRFTDISTGGPHTEVLDMGNSNIADTLPATTTYFQPGAYTVILRITNGTSTDSAILTIRVFAPPIDSFTSISRFGCVGPNTCHMDSFINLSLPGSSPIMEYAWDFGDSTLAQSQTDPTHCYQHTGSHTVILVARDSNGCQTSEAVAGYEVISQAPVATVSATPTQTCNTSLLVHFTGSGTSYNGPMTYAWYFNPGHPGTSAQQNPNYTYNAPGIYNPLLIVTDSVGCTDTASIPIYVTDVIAGFKAASTQACAGLAMQFTDTSNFANAWSWNFGDVTPASTLQNPAHIYTTSGTYTVTLTVSYGPCTNTVTMSNYIHVTQPINFTFSGNPTTACSAPLNVNFTNTAVGATAYAWNFGDLGTAITSSATHTYTAAGNYTVSLSVTNASGCVNTQTDSFYIKIGNPGAIIAVDSFHGCAPVTIAFSTTSTTGGVIAYQWVWGDGTPNSTTANANHTFATGGTYLPYLVVTTAGGCKDTVYAADSVKVGTPLVPNFSAHPTTQCVDQDVNFTNLTQGITGITTFDWNFGDNNHSTQTDPTHVYSDTGIYTVTLVVSNQGCKTDTVRIKYITIVVPKALFLYKFNCNDPSNVTFKDTSQGAQTWIWYFGDGDTSHAQNPPVHHYDTAGNYTIMLVVSNSITGCIDSNKQTLAIGASHVGFGATPRSGCNNLLVNFSDSSVFASGWLWNFGDNNSSSLKNPTHTYRDTGKFTVTLIINPGAQCADTLVMHNYITVYGIIEDLVAQPSVGCVPMHVAFTDSSSSYQGTITSWKWYYGVNNDSAFGRSTSFIYNAVGTYTATLVVTDSRGCTATESKQISVKSDLAFFTSDTIVCPGELAHFHNLSQNAGAYFWSFGDDSTSIDSVPTHAYAHSGYDTVMLVAINTTYGCRDTFRSPIPVHVDTPTLDFTPSSTFSQCPPFPVQFTTISNRSDLQWMWYFGDGDTSTARDPFHIYIYPGYYDVTLVGTDSFGCSGSRTYHDLIQVKGPIGHFHMMPGVGCVPLTVSFTGTTASTESSIFTPGPGAVYDNQIDVTYTYTRSGAYQPIYTLTDSFGCTVPYVLAPVVVGSYPYQNLPPDTMICKGNYAQLNLPAGDSLQIAEHFLWTSNLGQSYLSCDTCRSPVVMSPDTITYYVTSISVFASNNDTATCVAKDTITVNVDALPQIFPGIDFRICPNDTLQLHAGPGVTEAVWTPDYYISDTSSPNPKAWPPDTTTYRVTGTNDAGCSISRIVKLYPITKVVADIAVSDTIVCEGTMVPVDVVVEQASFNDTMFLWSPAKYLNSDIIQNATATLPPGVYNYQVIVSSRHCISDTATMHIIVSSKPDLEAGISQTVAYGTVVQLYGASHQSVNYTWTPSVDSFSCLDCRRPFVTVTQTETVYVTAENEYGCKTTDSVELRVVACDAKMIFVPNTFTPNNDGLNDRLFVRGAGLRELEYFRVFDRWGNLVFETKNLSEGWDGTYAGKAADIATYAYVLRGICSSGSVVDMNGNVTLIR